MHMTTTRTIIATLLLTFAASACQFVPTAPPSMSSPPDVFLTPAPETSSTVLTWDQDVARKCAKRVAGITVDPAYVTIMNAECVAATNACAVEIYPPSDLDTYWEDGSFRCEGGHVGAVPGSLADNG